MIGWSRASPLSKLLIVKKNIEANEVEWSFFPFIYNNMQDNFEPKFFTRSISRLKYYIKRKTIECHSKHLISKPCKYLRFIFSLIFMERHKKIKRELLLLLSLFMRSISRKRKTMYQFGNKLKTVLIIKTIGQIIMFQLLLHLLRMKLKIFLLCYKHMKII